MSLVSYAYPNFAPQEASRVIVSGPSTTAAGRHHARRWAIINEEEEMDGRVEHEFFLRERSSSPVISLRCKSRAISGSHKPVFFDGDTIEGGVQLMMPKTSHVEEITVRIRGRIAPPETGRPDIFWSTTLSLWKSSRDNPQTSLYKVLTGSGARVAAGNYSWPFALQLPLKVKVDTDSDVKVYPLPPSYQKSGPSAQLEYEILVVVYRGLLLDSYALSVPFVYIPRSCPEYPMGRFQGRSQEIRGHVTGLTSPEYPGNGGEAWTSPSMTIEGTIFGNRMAAVECRAIFERPLIYPRGFPISFTIVLESDDRQALDLVAPNLSFTLEQKAIVAGDQVWEDTLATGSCASVEETSSSSRIRRLNASLECPRETKPTFSFITFTLQHSLVLCFRPPHRFFTPSNACVSQLTQSIKIVTDRVFVRR